MEDTLITKVKNIEQEAEERITQVQKERKESLADMKAAEEQVLDDIRKKASQKGESIFNDHIDRAKNEINQMKQEREKSVQAIHDQAQKNRQEAIQKTVDMFTDKYLTTN